MEIDNLSVTLKTNGADDAIRRIWDMAASVDSLAKGVSQIDASTLKAFAEGMAEIKKAAPTGGQVTNMKAFTDAISSMCTVIGSANTTQFATDLSNISDAAKGGTRTATAWQKAASSMNSYSQAAQQAASASNSVSANSTPPMPKASYQDLAMQFRTAYGELSKVYDVSKTIGGSLVKMGALVPTSKFKALEERAAGVKEKYDELRATIARGLETGQLTEGSKEYEKMTRELQALNNEYDQLILKQKELALSGGGFTINPTLQKGLDSFKSGFTGVINLVKNGLGGAFKAASGHVSSFVKQLRSANLAQKAFKKTMDSLKSMPAKFIKELTRIGKMLKLMVTRMALRAVIKEVGNGFKSLAIHSDEFNQSVSDVINASKQLGYSFAAMVSPLINALAPAIVYVINLLTQLLNAINQVFSALTGAGTWNRAKKFTDSWRDSIGGAGKAAKELKKTVLGFDELNQLQDNKNSGGGGNNIADMFETVPIDQKWKDFADWLKEMWKNKDFYDLGKKIGEKLRDVLESIPWDLIRKTSNDLGKCLATLLNGFVEVERLGFDIGYTLAQAVNTVFEFVNGFVHNLHWDSVGKFIADVFNGFFETIDWKLIKDTVVTGLKGIAEAIQSFINNFHWDNISNFIINAVDTIASGIRAFFEGIDWSDLGAKIGEQLMKSIKGIDWRNVGHAIADIFQAAINFFGGLLDQLDVETVLQAASDLVASFFENVDMTKAGENIAKVLNFIIDFIKGFWQENGDTIKEEVGKFFKGFWDEVDKEDLMDAIGLIIKVALLAGIAKAIPVVLAEVGKQMIGKLIAGSLFNGFGTTAMRFLYALGSDIGAWAAGIGAKIASAFSGLGTTLASAGSAIGTWLTADVGATVAGGGAAAGGMLASALVGGILAFLGGSEIGKKIGEFIFPDDKELYEQYEGISGTLQLYKDTFVTIGEEIGYAWDDAKVVLKDDWDAIKENAQSLAEKTGEKFEDFKNKATTAFDNVKQAGSDFVQNTNEHWTNATTSLQSFSDKVAEKTTTVKTKFGEMKTDVSTNVENIKTKFGEFSDKAKETKENVSTALATLKDNAKTNIDEIKTKVGEFKDDWTQKWADAKDKLIEFKDNAKTQLDELKEKFIDFKDKIAEAFGVENWTFDGVADGLKKTFEKAKDAIKGVWNNIADKLNGEHEVGSSSFKINLPKFARGGFPEDGLFMANHHELVGEFSNGKTAVANNGQIVAGIENGVYKAVSQAMANNSSSNSYIANEIIVDGDVIARTITKAQEKQNRRYSPLTV